MQKKKILFSVLNWGLGHAARSIPIIRELEKRNFSPVLASDGSALLLLQKEFPHLQSYELPSYNIEYSTKGSLLKWKLILESPKILQAIKAEKKVTAKLISEENIQGIISDSRFGTRHKGIKSVFITHQLNVLSGNTTWLSSTIHQKYISKFDQCWVPDSPGKFNLSGILGHFKTENENIKYIGALSRLEKQKIPLKYDYLVLLSGPEPQRTLLQNILFRNFRSTDKQVLFVRGVINDEPFTCLNPSITIKNYLFGKELQEAINSSRIVISRSGYTSLMDLAKLEKRAFFIPTPGQFEQEYLAERLMKLRVAPYCRQNAFKLSLLEDIEEYSGLRDLGFNACLGDLLAFFEGEGKFASYP